MIVVQGKQETHRQQNNRHRDLHQKRLPLTQLVEATWEDVLKKISDLPEG